MKKLLVVGAVIAALSVTPAHAGSGWGGIGAGIAAGIIAGVIASQARPHVVYDYPRVRHVRPRVQRPRTYVTRPVKSREPMRQAPAKLPPTMG
jgi:hypothetical protein